jgi:hypothetical protein
VIASGQLAVAAVLAVVTARWTRDTGRVLKFAQPFLCRPNLASHRILAFVRVCHLSATQRTTCSVCGNVPEP